MRPTFVTAVICGLCALAAPAAAGDWPHLRGPSLDGRAPGTAAFEPSPGAGTERAAGGGPRIGLELAWASAAGSGYSGVAVAGGRAVTMFQEGAVDVVAAFDASTGERLWRHALGATHKGHDGSQDGPLSSPVIHDGTVYALAPAGELLALRLADGGTIWSRQLETDFGATAPHFGFTTTPVVDGELLIVQAGGPGGKSIAALDRRTGETRWSLGDEKVDFQSPALMTLGGRRQLVAVAGKRIVGLVPRTGELLWQHALAEDDDAGSAMPAPAGEDRFLLLIGGQAAVFHAARQHEAWTVEELYRTKDLGNTYALPVHHDGHLYGFRNQFLTCVDAASGQRRWRSRPPGGRGLIAVGDRLVIFGAGGHVVVAEASPEGYRELASLAALEGSGYTWPSFAGDRIYVRNLESIAAVRVTGGSGARVEAPEHPGDHRLARFARQVAASTDRTRMVQEFLKRHERLPIVDGRWVHFVYRGQADDVAVSGTMVASGNAEALRRIEGTDMFYRSYLLEPGGRWEYRFIVDFDQRVLDPANPRTVPGDWAGELSEVAMPDYRWASHQSEPPAERPAGRMESFSFASEILGNEREIDVWLPPGYDEGDRRYPLLLVHQGSDWQEHGRFTRTLDNLTGDRIAPMVVVFVDPVQAWWTEGGGSATTDHVRMLVEELVPRLESSYRLQRDPSARGVLGKSYFGVTVALAALGHPDVFGKLAVQSPALGLGSDDRLFELIRDGRGRDVRVYLDWNRWEARNVDTGLDLGRDSRKLAEALEAGGYTVTGGEALDSHGWGAWRARLDRVLEALFPAKG